MQQTKGFAILEALLALAILAVAGVIFLQIFSSSTKHSVQTRNRTMAILLANSLMDEVEAHTYGEPPPRSWATGVVQPATVVIQGRPQLMEFHQELAYQNGSFVGGATGDTDLVTVTITWKEGVGDDQTTGQGRPQDNKLLVVQIPVWR